MCRHIPGAWPAAGYGFGRQPSFVQRAVERLAPRLMSRTSGGKAIHDAAASGSAAMPAGSFSAAWQGGQCSLPAVHAAPDPSPSSSSGRGGGIAAAADAEDGTEAPQAVPLAAAVPRHAAPTKLPQSPFEVASSGSSGAGTGRSLAPPGKSNMMMYQHSMIRLRSSVVEGRKLDLAATLEEGRAEGEAEGRSAAGRETLAAVAAAAAAEPELALEAPHAASGADSCRGIASSRIPSAVQEQAGGSWQNTAIRVAAR